jgi:threonine dehydrogenase-like Zn-dependent dehydrogenase
VSPGAFLDRSGGTSGRLLVEFAGRSAACGARTRGIRRFFAQDIIRLDEGLHAGLGDQIIVTTLCPGGKERMRRLMQLVRAHRINLRPLLTHTFSLDEIAQAYDLFQSRGQGVLKVAIRVS